MPPAKFARVALARLPGVRERRAVVARRAGRPHAAVGAGRERADAPTAPVSALLPTVVPLGVGTGRDDVPRLRRAPSSLRRSSNVHGAAGALPDGKQPMMRRSVPAPLERRVVREVLPVRLVGGRVEAVDAAQHGAGLGVDEHGPGHRDAAVVDDVGLERAAEAVAGGRPRPRAPAGAGASPPTRSWPKPARAPRTDTAPRVDAGVAGRGPPGLLAGQAAGALRARRVRPARRTRSRRGRRTMPTASVPPATGSPPTSRRKRTTWASEPTRRASLTSSRPGHVAEQRRVAAHELARGGLRRAARGPPRASRRAREDAARGAEAAPAHAGAEPRRGGALGGRWARSRRAGRSCPAARVVVDRRPRRTRRRAPSALPRPSEPPPSASSCRRPFARPTLRGRLDRVSERCAGSRRR